MGPIEQLPSCYEFRHLQAVEAVLGTTLLPDGVEIVSLPDDSDRCDIHIKAHQLVLQAIAHHTGKTPDTPEPLTLTPQEHTLLASRSELQLLGGQVALANSMAREQDWKPEQAVEADAPTTARSLMQGKITQQAFQHTQTLPADLQYTPDQLLSQYCKDGLAVISPTGSGKTVMEAAYFRQAGVGQPINGPVTRRRQGLLITSNQKLVDQFAGLDGDDTFRRFLGPDINVSRFFQYAKDTSGDVVVTTPNSVGGLNVRDYDPIVVDEGHRGLAPKLIKLLGSLGTRPVLFTATPAYDKHRDLRALFRSIEEGTLRGFVEQGILSPVRLQTFKFKKDPETMAAHLAHHYLDLGRKVIVYCPVGTRKYRSGPARRVARLINELQEEQVAASVGAHNVHSVEHEKAFSQGTFRALTTCRRLLEGWNEDVDVVICIGPHYSRLNLGQKIGRAMRHGQYISELIELVPDVKVSERAMASIWQLFGLEHVSSGLIIGPAPEHVDDYLQKVGEPGSSSGRSSKRNQELFVPELSFPPELYAARVVDKPVRSIVLGKNALVTEPPPGSVKAAALAEEYEVSLTWIHKQLDNAGYSYEGIWIIEDDYTQREYDRWYEPAAAEHFKNNPPPKTAAEGSLTALGIGKRCDTSPDHVNRIAFLLYLQPQPRLGEHDKEGKYFTPLGTQAIIKAIEATPVAYRGKTGNDVAISELAEELSYRFVTNYCNNPANDVSPVYKRRHPDEGLKGFRQYVTAGEATKIRQDFYKTAGDQYMSLAEVATLAGVNYSTVEKHLRAAERSAVVKKRPTPEARQIGHIPRDMGLALADRLKRDTLAPHLVPLSLIAKRVACAKVTAHKWLTANRYVPELKKFGLAGAAWGCYPWEALQALEEKYGLAAGAELIDYTKVARGADDTNLIRLTYSQGIQLNYLDIKLLQPLPSPQLSAAPAEASSSPNNPGPPPKATAHPPKPSLDEPPGQKPPVAENIPRTRPKAGRNTRPSLPKRIPPGYVNLEAYLAAKRAPCSAEVLIEIARRKKVDRDLIQQPNGEIWGPEEAARSLVPVIREWPIAHWSMRTPAIIAGQFMQHGIRAGQVAFLATKVPSVRAKAYRVRKPDGTAGRLTTHYDAEDAERIGETLQLIIREGHFHLLGIHYE